MDNNERTNDEPRFGQVDCRDYDEHREGFEQVAGEWHCPTCHEEDGRHICVGE